MRKHFLISERGPGFESQSCHLISFFSTFGCLPFQSYLLEPAASGARILTGLGPILHVTHLRYLVQVLPVTHFLLHPWYSVYSLL